MARGSRAALKSLLIFDQNVRGLRRDEKKEELYGVMRQRGAFAATLQETWFTGNETLEGGGFTTVCSSVDADQQCNRGEQGVAIVLSAPAAQAWRESGEKVVRVSGRVIGLRLEARDAKDRIVGLVLISAYAPVGNAPDDAWNTFFDDLDVALRLQKRGDVLFVGIDGNSSLGARCRDDEGRVCGPYGVRHVNDAGRRMDTFLASTELAAAGTFFDKPNHTTWVHPRSHCAYQLDHVVVERAQLGRLLDVGVTQSLVDSDHRALKCRIRIHLRLQRPPNVRASLSRRNLAVLAQPAIASMYCSEVRKQLKSTQATTALECTERSTYSQVQQAMRSAAASVLPRLRRAQPGWFSAAAAVLEPLIERRNSCFASITNAARTGARRTRSLSDRLKNARQALHRAVTHAKEVWILSLCKDLNAGAESLGGSSKYWDTISRLRSGLVKTKSCRQTQMRKADGSRCSSPRENADVFKEHFSKLYARQPRFDATIIESIDQLPIRYVLADMPPDVEIKRAVRQLNNSAAGASELRAEMWKAISNNPETFPYLRQIVRDFWQTEVQPEEWDVGRLGILPKKGDLSLPGNYRGIMMLEVAQKIISNIVRARLGGICADLDHESQCGFRPERGTADATFSLKMALKKRREHSLETWVLFIDFVKAFDRVPRELLWSVLAKFGVPPKLVRIIKALHRIQVKFSVSGAEASIDSIIGVKQGDVLGPILFVLYMAALTISWKKRPGRVPCVYRTKEDFVLTGRSFRAKGTEFEFDDSEYADDAAFLFSSRSSLANDTPCLMKHCADWGMEVHAGDRNAGTASKTEVLFVAAPGTLYEDPATWDNTDLSDIELGDGRFIPVTAEFKYLGSMLNRNCRDELDVDVRLKAASAAFGALKRCVFSVKAITARAKRAVYVGLILAILLHGAESWCLTEDVYNRLRRFHAQSVRAMCRVTLKHSWEHKISTSALLSRLDLEPIDTYISRRQLRWAGHVARMPMYRLPRKMLSSWCYSKRPVGSPQMTYGRGLYKALKLYDIPKDSWSDLAQDRQLWRKKINARPQLPSSSPGVSAP